MRITALKQKLAAILSGMDAINAAAIDEAGEPRELTAEEQADYNAKLAEANGLNPAIAREENILALKAIAAKPIALPGGAPSTGSPSVPPQVAQKLQPGIMVARMAIVLAGAPGQGKDHRAVAAHAETLYGSEMGQIVANMEQTTNSKGGFLVNTDYSSDFIDILRARVVIRQLGARTVPMPDGNLTIRRKTAGTGAGYIGERVPAPKTAATVGTINMTAKTLAALVPITNRLIRRASMSVEMMIREDLVMGAAVTEDQQFLRGTGSSTAPSGLRSLLASANAISANATANLANVTKDLGKIRLAVLNANVPMVSCGWIMSPRSKMFLETLRDGNGNIAFPTVADGTLYGYPIGVTTSVPDNLGTGTNESEIYFGDFSQFLIGDTEQVSLAVSDTAAYDDGGTMRAAFSNDETVIRLLQEHDTQVRYDTAFAVLTAVIWVP